MKKEKKQKLYCYVDETGQDTKGKLFIVSVVITDDKREELNSKLKKIEEHSGKGKVKWMEARHKARLAYIQAVLSVSASAQAAVHVDGLPKARIRWFGTELRRLSIKTSKVVGVRREESDAFIRLADACCGFVRLALSSRNKELFEMFKQAMASNHLKEV